VRDTRHGGRGEGRAGVGRGAGGTGGAGAGLADDGEGGREGHHLISRPIAKKLEEHPTLKGLYKPRDPRFVTQAKDEQSHCGYQEWHRDVDKEVVDWLTRNSKATPQQFMDKLREIYSRPEMLSRFPDGLRIL
jgi:hypothetical protein